MTLQVSPDAFLLRQIGETLYGSGWQAGLANILGVSDRSVRAWASGEQPVPPGVWHDIYGHTESLRGLLDYYNREVSQRLGESELQRIPNASPVPDMWGLHFALRTGSGRPVRCFIAREVLADRVNFPNVPFKATADYFEKHFDTFHRVAQRKYLEGDLERGMIVIREADLELEDLPHIRERA